MKKKIKKGMIIGLIFLLFGASIGTNVSATIITNNEESRQFDHPKDSTPRPIAEFYWIPSEPEVGEQVKFVSQAVDPDGQCTKWAWDFDYDGTDDKWGEIQYWTFDSPGDHLVRHWVAGNNYANNKLDEDNMDKVVHVKKGKSKNTEDIIEKEIKPQIGQVGRPIAEFYWIPSNPKVGQPVKFVSQAVDPDGQCTIWAWDFDHNGVDDAWGEEVYWTFYTKGDHLVRHWVAGNNFANDDGDQDNMDKVVPVGHRNRSNSQLLFEQILDIPFIRNILRNIL